MSFVQMKPGEIQVGRPVPWALYDQDKRLLLARGVVVESERQLEALLERGLFRKLKLGADTPSVVDEDEAPGEPRENKVALEDVKLGIGDTLQLQSLAEHDSARYSVRLVGYMRNQSVIVSTPVVGGSVLLMREGQAFVVRLFSGKSVYAFTTSIRKAVNTPFPHLHLSYPREVRGLVVRKGARAQVNIIAAVNAADGRTHAATISDLSIGGAQLAARQAMGKAGDEISVKFRVTVSGAEQYLTVPAVIRNVREDAAEGSARVHHGVQLNKLAVQEQLVLTAFVYQTLFEDSAEL